MAGRERAGPAGCCTRPAGGRRHRGGFSLRSQPTNWDGSPAWSPPFDVDTDIWTSYNVYVLRRTIVYSETTWMVRNAEGEYSLVQTKPRGFKLHGTFSCITVALTCGRGCVRTSRASPHRKKSPN